MSSLELLRFINIKNYLICLIIFSAVLDVLTISSNSFCEADLQRSRAFGVIRQGLKALHERDTWVKIDEDDERR